MTADGLVNGYPLPIQFAHNMDDPRSPYCLMNQTGGGMGEQAALTARKHGFQTVEAYCNWIAADAAAILREPIETQLRRALRLRHLGLVRWMRTTFGMRTRIVRVIDSLGRRAGIQSRPDPTIWTNHRTRGQGVAGSNR